MKKSEQNKQRKRQKKAELKKRNLKARNFGIKVRKAIYAVAILLSVFVPSGSTRKKHYLAFKMFHEFINQFENINDLRGYTRKHVLRFGLYLRRRVALGEIQIAVAHNYLSSVNSVFKLVRKDSRLRVRPVKDLYFPKRSYVRVKNRARTKIDKSWPRVIIAICKLCRELGLRFEEAVKINPKTALRQALSEAKSVEIIYGTKGGRPRSIPIKHQSQIDAIKLAISVQPKGHFSLIPIELSYVQFQRRISRAAYELDICFHDYRHAYVHKRIEEEFGLKARVLFNIPTRKQYLKFAAEKLLLSLDETRFLFKKAALTVAEEVGHSRDNIIVNYGA